MTETALTAITPATRPRRTDHCVSARADVDCRMWDLALDALGPDHFAIALDLPGHGGSSPLAGHSIGGPIASLYGATHPAAAVVSIDAPIRMETFAQLLASLRSELEGGGFAEAWAVFQASFHAELPADAPRALLRAGDRV
jgi:pimeloyl-ACP methyl ester carboxylesterase